MNIFKLIVWVLIITGVAALVSLLIMAFDYQKVLEEDFEDIKQTSINNATYYGVVEEIENYYPGAFLTSISCRLRVNNITKTFYGKLCDMVIVGDSLEYKDYNSSFLGNTRRWSLIKE